MKVAIEESGNFSFVESQGFEAYVLTALVVPESAVPAIATSTAQLRKKFGAQELKANKLGKELSYAAQVIGKLPVSAVVFAMDNEMMDRTFIAEFRLRQALRIASVRDDLIARGDVRAEVLEDIDELLRVVGQPGSKGAMSSAEFVQYQAVPDLMVAAVNRAVAAFAEPQWNNDHHHYSFLFDRKLPDRLNAGERYVDSQVNRIVGSNDRFGIALPEEWRTKLDHPFRVAFEDGESLSVNKLFGDRRFVDSEKDDLVQIADVIGGIVRQSIIRPIRSEFPKVHEALDSVASKLLRDDGNLVRIFRLNGALAPRIDPYRAVLLELDQTESLPELLPGGAILLDP